MGSEHKKAKKEKKEKKSKKRSRKEDSSDEAHPQLQEKECCPAEDSRSVVEVEDTTSNAVETSKKNKRHKKSKKVAKEASSRQKDSTRGNDEASTRHNAPDADQEQGGRAALLTTDRSPSPPKHAPASTAWNDWSRVEFNGDDARKSKFMRLMGAGKKTVGKRDASSESHRNAGHADTTALDSNVAQRMENDMERQFAAGMRARKDRFNKSGGGGAPTGLGYGA